MALKEAALAWAPEAEPPLRLADVEPELPEAAGDAAEGLGAEPDPLVPDVEPRDGDVAPGTEGTCGVDEVDGAVGADGTEGAEGTLGVEETDGVDGADGTCGVDGTLGVEGTDGVEGTLGAEGTVGADGTEI